MGRKHTTYVLKMFLFLFLSGVLAWRLVEVYSITVGFSPVHYTVDPLSLPSGHTFKCHEEFLYICSL